MDLDSLFVKEFNESLRVLPINPSVLDLPKLPDVPKGRENYVIVGIKDPYFGKLNKTRVQLVPRTVRLSKRLLADSKSFLKDRTGKVVKESVPLPKGSVAILSKLSLGLPWKYKEPEGFKYVDYMVGNGTKYFIYIIPKEVVYPVNQTALVVSTRKMQAYSGISLRTWTHGKVYLWVIPYVQGRTYINTSIIQVGVGLDYSKTVNDLLFLWIERGIISTPNEYLLRDGRSVAIQSEAYVLDSSSYQKYDMRSLGSRVELDGENL